MKSPKVVVAFDPGKTCWIASIQMPEGNKVGSWSGGNAEEARKKAKSEMRRVVADEARKKEECDMAEPTDAICFKAGLLERFLNYFSR
jgi:hypothetical protein